MNRIFDNGSSLRRIRFDIKIFEKNCDVFDKKHDRIHRFYDDIFETSVERISKMTMTNVVLKCNLNLMKMLFNALIWKVKKNVTFEGYWKVLSIDDQNSDLFRSYCLYLRKISKCQIFIKDVWEAVRRGLIKDKNTKRFYVFKSEWSEASRRVFA